MEKRKIKQELKNTFTGYWHYLALRAACQLSIFDDIENGYNTIEKLVQKNKANKIALQTLIHFLIDANTIIEINESLKLTDKGYFLTDNSPESLKQACILWGSEHLTTWQHLDFTLKTGKSSFEHIFDSRFFDYIDKEQANLINYHLAMAEYARDDYKNITECIDFSEFKTIADVGGGTGNLIKIIAQKFPDILCILAELPNVCKLVKTECENLKITTTDFFEKIPFKADAIILSRILHDWDDDKATSILKNCSNAVYPHGKIFIIEIMQDKVNTPLLNLNMMLMTESYERTYSQYDKLLKKINFKIVASQQLNQLQTILIAQKQ